MNNKSNPYSYGIILILLTYLSFGILDTIQKTAGQYHSVFVLLFVKYTFSLSTIFTNISIFKNEKYIINSKLEFNLFLLKVNGKL